MATRGILISAVLLTSAGIGHAQIQFAPAVQYNTGLIIAGGGITAQKGIVAADLNGDTRPDLIVGVRDGFAVLINKGDGTFLPQVVYGAGSGALSLAAIDLNKDGRLDIVAFTDSSATLYVFLNRGDGTFLPGASYPLGFRGKSMAVGDFNGDGALDVAVSYLSSAWGPVNAIYVNKGDGTLALLSTFSAPGNPLDCCGDSALSAADLNGDGLADIFTNNDYGSFSVLLNSGNGNMGAPVSYSNNRPTRLAYYAADLNGDGRLDIIATEFYYAFDLFLNQGGGAFAPPALFGLLAHGDSPLAIADFNNDGYLDVIAISNGALTIFANMGAATFSTPVTLTVGGAPYDYILSDAAVADFDGDGLLDIATLGAVAPGTAIVNVFRNTTPHTGPSTTVTGVFPSHGGNAGTVLGVNIVGTGFPSDANVKLIGPGPDIKPTSLSVSSAGNLITIAFDLNGTAPGSYALVLTKADGTVLSSEFA